jgi:protein-S-isoprenylcysteine O-methyltransferase Ste14
MNVPRGMVGERKIDHGDRMAGFSGIVGFGILFFGRVTREEGMMLETFGDHYREYMTQTSRVIPWMF